jgi:hypothetical protein
MPGKLVNGNPANKGGRPKGSVNKHTAAAKDIIAQAATDLGGGERLVAWAREDAQNERVFWGTIYPKLLPLQVTGGDGGPVDHRHDVTWRIVDPKTSA